MKALEIVKLRDGGFAVYSAPSGRFSDGGGYPIFAATKIEVALQYVEKFLEKKEMT